MTNVVLGPITVTPMEFTGTNKLDTVFWGKVGIGIADPTTVQASRHFQIVGADTTTTMGIHGGTGAAALEIGNGGSGNRYAYLDLVGDDTYTDYGLRIIRENTGPNAPSVIASRGTGGMRLLVQEAGPLGFYTNSNNRGGITSDGLWTIQKNAESLRIQSTGNGAHCYQSFYPDGSANSRHGYIGYPFDASNDLHVHSEAGALHLLANSGGMYLNTNSTTQIEITNGGRVNIHPGTYTGSTGIVLDVQSTTQAFRPPVMTTAQRDAIGNPVAGMLIFNSTTGVLNFHNGTSWGPV